MNRRQKLVQQQFLNREETVIKRLDFIYRKSLADIDKKIKDLNFKIGDLEEKYKWLDDNDPQKDVIQSMIQSKIYQKQYQQVLHDQLDGILNKMRTEQYLTVADYLDGCYEDGFVGSLFDLHGQDIPLIMPIDQTKLVRAVQLDSKISQGLYTRLGEDVGKLKKKIITEVSRSIATGTSYAQAARQLANQTRIGFNNAVRIARTEGHRIQTTAAMDVMEAAKEKGADVLKQWDAALDARTRESHVHVDGEIREVDEKFSNGLMFPGDPNGRASEVVNCRCALLQRARWALDDAELQTLKDRAAYYGLDKADQFDDFKKKYLKAVADDAPDYDCALAKAFGKDHYDAVHAKVVNCSDTVAADVWKKYESDIGAGDVHYKGGAHCTESNVYFNIDECAKGCSYKTPYQTVFHEVGHGIDFVTGRWYYSSEYKNALFPKTIRDEVMEHVNALASQLKPKFAEHINDRQWFIDNGFIRFSWEAIPKYSKSFAYKAFENEVKSSGSMLAWCDLSDMLEGATNAKIQCGIGHGKSYWAKNGDLMLGAEAFAEMLSATMCNPESMATIQKYLPKSYAVFKEMLESML